MNLQHHATILRVEDTNTFNISVFSLPVEYQLMRLTHFGINDARELIKKSYQRPIKEKRQLLVVITGFITLEAQNALLKVLEEPPHSTLFLFVVPKDFSILPTLASRFHITALLPKDATQSSDKTFETFLKLVPSMRLVAIEEAIKKEDHIWQQSIKQGLIRYLSVAKPTPYFSLLEYSARTLLTRGASNKMLLEQVALTLPIS